MQIPSKVKHSAEPRVGEVMVREVQTCTPRDTLERAAQLMWEHDCGALPVVDDSNHVVGVVTDRDVCMGAYTRGSALSLIAVGDVMAREPKTCASEDRLSKAESVLREHRVRRRLARDEVLSRTQAALRCHDDGEDRLDDEDGARRATRRRPRRR